MKIKRGASIPLVLNDPYFSIWSSSDNLYDKDTVHWSGIRQKMQGFIKLDDESYCFLGEAGHYKVIEQKSIDVTATSTKYTFENEKVIFEVRFMSPIILTDMLLVSRPCTYVDFFIERKVPCDVEIDFRISRDLVSQDMAQVVGGVYNQNNSFNYAVMGRANQKPLGGSGDRVTIDWGYVYLADNDKESVLSFSEESGVIGWKCKAKGDSAGFVLAYDDLLSVNYFGEWRKAYWTKFYPTIQDAIGSAFSDKEDVINKAMKFDADIYNRALEVGGESYAYLCSMSYRQVVAAHKLICDEDGNIIFLSKENDSNGCVGTVDISYPSMPLFLLYDTEYIKGMLRPIFRFADCNVWEYDYAPHDVGRYPYAWGQVYGVKREHVGSLYPRTQGRVRPPFYSYPAGNDIYEHTMQMPVEECGNMLIMMAAICLLDKNAEFALPYQKTLEKWVKYLIDFGQDPGEQLCTDDFAGHLAHNANLSVKAIMGIEAYSILQGLMKNGIEKEKYHKLAEKMALDWENRAYANDHYVLAFGEPDTWSLKYNLVWDRIFNSNLFSKNVFEKELAWYISKMNKYGVPLDSREDYTKSDWICWCAAMADEKEDMKKFITPIALYLENTSTRIPFGDFYDTVTGKYKHFIARSVQGGIFMPMFEKYKGETL